MARKIRVLFTIPNFDTAGSQFVVLSIIEKLNKNLFDVLIGVENLPELIPDIIPNAHKIHIDFSGNFLKDVYCFAKIIRRFEIDIVHSWDYRSNFVESIACRLMFKSFLYTKKNSAWSKRWFVKSVLSKHIAYDNPEMKSNFFSHFLLRHKTTFIPHGIDLEKFRPISSAEISEDVFKLCSVGNIGENKNQYFILKQLKELPKSIHLYLFGNADDEYLFKLKTLIERENLHNRIHFRNFINNNKLPELLSKFDLFVLASQNEGLPVSVLEALACGLPVLCSDSGGGTRHIFKDGKGGVVFNLNQPKQFNDALMRFYEDESYLQEKKKEALSVARNFDILREVKAYEVLYNCL